MPNRTNNVHKFIPRWVDHQPKIGRIDGTKGWSTAIIKKKQTSAGQYVALDVGMSVRMMLLLMMIRLLHVKLDKISVGQGDSHIITLIPWTLA